MTDAQRRGTDSRSCVGTGKPNKPQAWWDKEGLPHFLLHHRWESQHNFFSSFHKNENINNLDMLQRFCENSYGSSWERLQEVANPTPHRMILLDRRSKGRQRAKLYSCLFPGRKMGTVYGYSSPTGWWGFYFPFLTWTQFFLPKPWIHCRVREHMNESIPEPTDEIPLDNGSDTVVQQPATCPRPWHSSPSLSFLLLL